MRKKMSFYIIFMFLIVGVLTSIMPYPIFQNSSNISIADQEKINNYNETELSILSPAQSEISSVENLDWYKNVNNNFAINTKTRVIDVTSGKSYFVYRIGGSNHADVEPIDSENTKIFHELYNFEYSWSRRPVWVEVQNGKWVAGSINGFPHGESKIQNNDMDGHTCIHFLGSKTHGTKRVDKAHQDCVKSAYNQRAKLKNILKK